MSFNYFSGVNGIVHNWDPTLKCCHLEEGDVGMANMVKGYFGIDPLSVILSQTGNDIRHDLCADFLTS